MAARDTRIIERDGWYQVITPSSGSTQGNEIILSRVRAADADEVVRRTIADYAPHGVPFKWCVGPLTEPPDFGDVLERHGFTFWPIRGMAIDPRAWLARPRPEIAVELVTPATLPEYYECFSRGWEITAPDPIAWQDDHVRALATGRFHFFLARTGGVAVGTAGFIIKARSIYLVGGNVLASHRGRGIYRALLDERLRRAALLGHTLATTQAREATSAPILEQLGFETLFHSRVYKWDPHATLVT